jgi:signal recognition particle subunit SRP54
VKALESRVIESLSPGQQIVKIVNAELIKVLGGEVARLQHAAQPPSVIMLVGLQGAGKTTTAAKLALHLKHSGQTPLLVAADTRRPAAIDQLVTLGKQLDIPVFQEGTGESPVNICRHAVERAKTIAASWIIIDTQGRLHIDEPLMEELIVVRDSVKPSEILLVVDAMTGQDAVRVAGEFNARLSLTGLILTKMDGDARGGAVFSIKYVTGLPVKFIGIGEKSNALEMFYPDRLASRILGMGDVLTLIEKAEKAFDAEQAKKFEKKFRAAEFTLEDFLEQLRQFKKMGPLEQVMRMMPGFSKVSSQLKDGAGEQQLKKIEAMILSMTPLERHNPDIINGSRKLRIARGSGTTARDVNQLLNQFIQLKKLTKSLSKGKIPSNLQQMLKQQRF